MKSPKTKPLLPHEIAEDEAIVTMNAYEAHSEGMMAEAEAIANDPELLQAMHKLWGLVGRGNIDLESGQTTAWGNMQEGYEGEGKPTVILNEGVPREEFQVFVKKTGINEDAVAQLLNKFLEDNSGHVSDVWTLARLLSLQLKFSDTQGELEGNLARLNSYISDSTSKYGTVYLGFVSSMEKIKDKVEFNESLIRWTNFIDSVMNELKGMSDLDIYAKEIFNKLLSILSYISKTIVDNGRRKQELDALFSNIFNKIKEIKKNVELKNIGDKEVENIASLRTVITVRNALVDIYQFLNRTKSDNLAVAYGAILDFAIDFTARRNDNLYEEASGGSHGLSSAIGRSDTPEQLKENVAALNRFLVLSETLLKNNIPEHIIYSFMQKLGDILDNRAGSLFAVYMNAISDLIQSLDSQDVQDLFLKGIWITVFDIANKLSPDPANLKATFLELASVLKEMNRSGIYLEDAETYLSSFSAYENNIAGIKSRVSAILSFKNKLSAQSSDKDSRALINLAVRNAVNYFSKLPTRDFLVMLDSLSEFILGLLSIGNKNIAELLIENIKDYQGILSSREKVTIALYLVKANFIPTEGLINYALKKGDTQAAIADFERIRANIANGGFKLAELKDPEERGLYIDVEYSHNASVLSENGLNRFSYDSYKDFISGVHRPGQVHLSASQFAEIDYAIYEAIKLLDFIDGLISQGKTINKEIVVVANMSYGGFVIDIIEEELARRGIKIIRTKIGSSQCHENPWYFVEDLFNENDLLYIANNRPVMIVVDGTKHLVDREGDQGKRGRYPDAYQGYRNFILAFNEALANALNDREMRYRQDLGKDGDFIAGFGASFTKLRDKIIGLLKGARASKDYYDFKFWNPGDLKSILREKRQPVAEADNVKPEQIRGPAIVFANAVLMDEDIPAELKRINANSTHQPAELDDNSVITDIFLSVTDRGTQYEKKLKPVIKDRLPVVMRALGIKIKNIVTPVAQQGDLGHQVAQADASREPAFDEGIIRTAAETAYKEVAKETQEASNQIYFSQLCKPFSNVLNNILQGMGYRSWIVTAEQWEGDATHDFVMLEKDGHFWLIDGTWQQFLVQEQMPTDYQKAVMILEIPQQNGEVQEGSMEKKLADFGVPRYIRRWWISAVKNKIRETVSRDVESSAAAPSPAGVIAPRQLYQTKSFETALGEGQLVWLQVYNDGSDNFDNFRVYINPKQGTLDKAVEIAKQTLARSEAPHAAFKYLAPESLFREQHPGETKLVFFCKTAEDAVQIARIFSSHPSYNDLGPSKALTDTLPIDNIMSVSGATREDVAARKPQAIEKLATAVGAFKHEGIILMDGKLNDSMTRIPANPSELVHLIGQSAVAVPATASQASQSTPVKEVEINLNNATPAQQIKTPTLGKSLARTVALISAIAALFTTDINRDVSGQETGAKALTGKDNILMSAKPDIAHFSKSLKDADILKRLSAAEALARPDVVSPEVAGLLSGACNDANPAVRRTALKGLAKTERLSQATVKQVIGLLKDPNQDVRWEAVDVLWSVKDLQADSEIISALLNAAKSKDVSVRRVALSKLGTVGQINQAIFEVFCQAHKDSERFDLETTSLLMNFDATGVDVTKGLKLLAEGYVQTSDSMKREEILRIASRIGKGNSEALRILLLGVDDGGVNSLSLSRAEQPLWLLARFDFGTLDKKPAIDILLGMLDQGKDCADQLIVLGKGNKYLK
ncbi:MAG: HEAT repeat domain-containing protein, partial [Candidatus Omnitrophica bacterium]|nr:HEAT repeat domain-containing protein [Candidatus Omnitrophota bacterium]